MESDNQIVYKTSPRLFTLCMPFLGFLFFGLLAWLAWSSNKERKTLILIVLTVFIIGSLLSFYYFISTRIVKLANDRIFISYIFLPFHKTLLFSQIKDITQKSKEVSSKNYFSYGFSFTELSTKIEINGNKEIKLNTIAPMDFEELKKGFNKMKNGNHQFASPKKSFLLYFLDNLDGIVWVVVAMVVTIGLAHGLITRFK